MLKKMTVALAALALSGLAAAAPTALHFTQLANASGNSNGTGFSSMAVDPVTGKVYARDSYGAPYGSGDLRVYADRAAFEANQLQSTVALANGGFYGTYFAVRDGVVYGRTDVNSSAFDAWSAGTGAQLRNFGINDFYGANGSGFTWGGFSNVNFMQDNTGLYAFGAAAANNGNWVVDKVSGGAVGSQTVTPTNVVSAGTAGMGFIVNGHLFSNYDFYDGGLRYAVDLATNTQSAVNIKFEDMVGTQLGFGYYSEFSYDYTSDSLYMFNTSGQSWWRADAVSQQLDVPFVNDTGRLPEPGSLALVAAALAGLGFMCRRRA